MPSAGRRRTRRPSGRPARTRGRSPGNARRARRRSPGRPGSSIRGRTSTLEALKRRCQAAGIVMTTSPPISSDQWRWCRIAAPSSRARNPRSRKIAVRPLEDRDAGPGQCRRVRDDPVPLGLDAEPVLDPAHHDRDDRAHRGGRLAGGLASSEAALDRLGRRDRLGDGEADGRVDADAAGARLLHRHEARRPSPGT